MKPLITGLGICVILLGAAIAHGDPVWDDGYGSDHNWSSANNWDPDQVPASCDDITITVSGTTSVFDSGMTPTTFGILTIGNASAVTLQVDKADISFGSGSLVGSTSFTGSYDVYFSSSVCSGSGDLSLGATSVAVTVGSGQTVSPESLTIDAASADRFFVVVGSGTIDAGSVDLEASGEYSSQMGVGTNAVVMADTFSVDGYDSDDTATLSGSGTVSARSMTVAEYSAVSVSNLDIVAQSDAAGSLTAPASNATVQPDTLGLQGYDSTYRVTLDANGDVSADYTELESYVDVDAADGATFSAGAMSVTAASANLSVVTNSTGAMTASTLTLDADTADASRTLTKAGAGTLTVTTSTTLTGDDDSGNYPATFTLSAGAFDPAALYVNGGDTSARKAIFDYDAGTLTNPDSMTMQGYASVDSEASITVAGQLTVDAGAHATSADIDMAATTTFTASSLVIGDASYACTLSFTGAGTGANASKLVTN